MAIAPTSAIISFLVFWLICAALFAWLERDTDR